MLEQISYQHLAISCWLLAASLNTNTKAIWMCKQSYQVQSLGMKHTRLSRRLLELKRRIERAQRLVRKHVKPGVSLVDELIAERRAAARNE